MTPRSRQAVRNAYSMQGDVYDASRIEDPRGELQSRHDVALVKELLPSAEPGMRVVEVGAGTGRFTTILLEAGFDVIATDINETLLEKLRHKIDRGGWSERCEVARADLFELPETLKGADLVVCLHVVPRLQTWDDQRAALLELTRILRPGGALVFNYNNRRSPFGRLTSGYTTPPTAIEGLLREAGLEVRDSRARWFLARRLQSMLPMWACRAVASADRHLATLPPMFAWDVFLAAGKAPRAAGGQR